MKILMTLLAMAGLGTALGIGSAILHVAGISDYFAGFLSGIAAVLVIQRIASRWPA